MCVNTAFSPDRRNSNRLAIFFVLLGLAAIMACPEAMGRPIRLHPENPHYFLWRDEPTILITSGEHYGAVLNRDFHYKKYLATLGAQGFNLTRTFSGAYCEPVGAFKIKRNTLAPAKGKLICPWARSATPGYANGGNKFDLTKWDGEYFKRPQKRTGKAWSSNWYCSARSTKTICGISAR